MSDAAHPPTQAPDDWTRPILERQIHILSQLAEDGLQMAQAIKRQATGAETPAEDVSIDDLSLAFSRVARAVRLTVLLQARLIEELKNPNSRKAGRRDPRATVLQVVQEVAEAEHAAPEAVERMMGEAAEQLDRDEIWGELKSQPASVLIDRICQSLGLHPDWPALAEQDWAREELASGKAGAPLKDAMAVEYVYIWPEPGDDPAAVAPRVASG